MKIMQAFDCQEMPTDVRKKFFDLYQNYFVNPGNDVFITWQVGECDDESYEMYGERADEHARAVDAWLRQVADENDLFLDDEVLIKHWW